MENMDYMLLYYQFYAATASLVPDIPKGHYIPNGKRVFSTRLVRKPVKYLTMELS